MPRISRLSLLPFQFTHFFPYALWNESQTRVEAICWLPLIETRESLYTQLSATTASGLSEAI